MDDKDTLVLRLQKGDVDDLWRILEMVTRLERGSYPSAVDQALALALYRKVGAQQ